MKRFGVSGEAVGRAKAAIAQNYFGRLETIDGVGDDLAYYEALGDWKLTSAYLSDIQKVTPQRVMDVPRKYLTFRISGFLNTFPSPSSATCRRPNIRPLYSIRLRHSVEA